MRYRWNPWQDLNRLQRDMSSLFENHLHRSAADPEEGWGWRPPVDIYEDPERFVVSAELPGINPDKVDLRVEDNRLTIRGDRNMEFEEKKENYHRIEREYGTFSRTFTLPTTVEPDKIRAEYKHGLLRVTIPKRPEVQPHKIQVKITE